MVGTIPPPNWIPDMLGYKTCSGVRKFCSVKIGVFPVPICPIFEPIQARTCLDLVGMGWDRFGGVREGWLFYGGIKWVP